MLTKQASTKSHRPRHINLFISASAAVMASTEAQSIHLNTGTAEEQYRTNQSPWAPCSRQSHRKYINLGKSMQSIRSHPSPFEAKKIIRVSTLATVDDEPCFSRSCRHRNPAAAAHSPRGHTQQLGAEEWNRSEGACLCEYSAAATATKRKTTNENAETHRQSMNCHQEDEYKLRETKE
jgi:hypothetical protein